GAQAVIPDVIEVVTERKHRDGAVDEPVRAVLVGSAILLADRLVRHDGPPAGIRHWIASVIGVKRTWSQSGRSACRARYCGDEPYCEGEPSLVEHTVLHRPSHAALAARCTGCAWRYGHLVVLTPRTTMSRSPQQQNRQGRISHGREPKEPGCERRGRRIGEPPSLPVARRRRVGAVALST